MPMQPSPAGGNRSHPSSAAAASSSSSSPADLKKKAITCLNKLSDRDTFAIASAELEKMAVSLSPDCYAPFLSCIYHTDASHKSPVRRQCVRLLTTLARTHANRLTPFLPKMLLSILRRLRDADSSVRSACVDAVSAAAASVTRPPFSTSFLKPLADAILLDQDLRLQTGAALCLAAAVDASPTVDPAHLQRVLPRFLKLLSSDAFKAKPALLSAVASIARAGGAHSPNLLTILVPALVGLLGSADWAARKAAAEALLSVADSERNLVGDLKDACLLQFEARRFDKVHIGCYNFFFRSESQWYSH